MPDSVTVANLPGGYPAYLGYCDGLYNTAGRLAATFPHARRVILTVTGNTLEADGVDCERGDLGAAAAAAWVNRKLKAAPAFRPVLYAGLATAGFTMTEALSELSRLGVARSRVRLLTAHYDGEHICAPGRRNCRDASGRAVTFTADGTQWTGAFRGNNGAAIDMSALADDFFAALSAPVPQSPAPAWQETAVNALPTLAQGDPDAEAVRTLQGLLCARGHTTTVDGDFDGGTIQSLKDFQKMRGIPQTGHADAKTWPYLLGVS